MVMSLIIGDKFEVLLIEIAKSLMYNISKVNVKSKLNLRE